MFLEYYVNRLAARHLRDDWVLPWLSGVAFRLDGRCVVEFVDRVSTGTDSSVTIEVRQSGRSDRGAAGNAAYVAAEDALDDVMNCFDWKIPRPFSPASAAPRTSGSRLPSMALLDACGTTSGSSGDSDRGRVLRVVGGWFLQEQHERVAALLRHDPYGLWLGAYVLGALVEHAGAEAIDQVARRCAIDEAALESGAAKCARFLSDLTRFHRTADAEEGRARLMRSIADEALDSGAWIDGIAAFLGLDAKVMAILGRSALLTQAEANTCA